MSTTAAVTTQEEEEDSTPPLPTPLSDDEQRAWVARLDAFVLSRCLGGSNNSSNNTTSTNRPLALISSGGTAADVDGGVRSLENFSTGTRGALAVEGLLRRGYAVIHLHRAGSAAAPWARVLAELLSSDDSGSNQKQSPKAHEALPVSALARLFEDPNQEGHHSSNDNNDEDPWLTTIHNDNNTIDSSSINDNTNTTTTLQLSHRLANSSRLQQAWREQRQYAPYLLTVPYRTVEEYLQLLQLCAEALRPAQTLALTYLCAAVSDFYLPGRSAHKIQSSSAKKEMARKEKETNDGDNPSDNTTTTPATVVNPENGTLTLTLQPVPKTIRLLRRTWCPRAFCVSFKLETDESILRQKAEGAVRNYNVHMVIGNLLATRHQQVWLLRPGHQKELYPTMKDDDKNSDWTFESVQVSSTYHPHSNSSSAEALEDLILDHVVQAHFEFISWHHLGSDDNKNAADAQRRQEMLQQERQRQARQLAWKRAQYYGAELTGWLLSLALSYAATVTFQRWSSAMSNGNNSSKNSEN